MPIRRYAGDPERYQEGDIRPFDGKSFDTEQSMLWAKLGLEFPFNEFRACWRMGGEALVQRLGDKSYSWSAVASLVPDMIAAGLLAPWRVLDAEHLAICLQYARLHAELGPYLVEQARQCSKTGEPIVRSMEYAFPGEGFETCTDQYMLGDRYLVAPMLTKGTSRTVKLPAGRWVDEYGKTYKGGKTYTLEVPLGRVPCFTKKTK